MHELHTAKATMGNHSNSAGQANICSHRRRCMARAVNPIDALKALARQSELFCTQLVTCTNRHINFS